MGDTQGVCIRSKWYRGTRGTKRYERYGELYEDVQRV